MSKVLIINPPRFKGMNVRRDERSADVLETEVSPFYQGAVLAQYLREQGGHQVEVLDANGANIDLVAVKAWVKGHSPADLAVVKAADDTLLFDADVCSICKQFGILTMLWEPILSPADPERVLSILNKSGKGVDGLILGEAEATVRDFLIMGRQAGGLAFWDNGRISVNPRSEDCRLKSLEDLPIPDFSDLPVSKYKSWFGKGPWMTLFTSRGCPGSCSYCLIGGSTVFRGYGRAMRFQSAERIVKEVSLLIGKFGVKHITFWDDCFTLNRQRVEDFCRLVKDSGLKFEWSCMSRVDLVDEDLLKLMKDAGLTRIGFGIESGSQKILDSIPKRVSVEQNLSAVRLSKKIGLWVWIYLVVGLPEEDWSSVAKTIDFVKRAKPDFMFLGSNTPFPGTANFDECRRLGLIDGDMFESIISGEFVTGSELMAASKYLSKEEIAEAKRRIHRAYVFSSPAVILSKIITNLHRLFDFSYLWDKFSYFILRRK
jgi:anaerobic magnesium-protoporphyrin IX monomethyl ester cyclase